MTVPLSECGSDTVKAINRKVIARFAAGVIARAAEAAANHQRFDLTLHQAQATLKDTLRIANYINVNTLASIDIYGDGDPNPTLVHSVTYNNHFTKETPIPLTLSLLQDYATEVAVVELSKQYAQAILESPGCLLTEESKGLDIVDHIDLKIKRLCTSLARSWSWKALEIYTQGAQLDEDDSDYMIESESEEGEEGE